MSDWKTHIIVNILVKDETLVKARKRFARILEIRGNSLTDFENRYQQQTDSFEYFCDVLEKWKSINGNEATISLLTNTLRENEFAVSADRLNSYKDPPNNWLPRVKNSFNKYYASLFLLAVAIAIAIYLVPQLTLENQTKKKFKVTDEVKDKDENKFTASADPLSTSPNFSLVSTFGVKEPVFNFVGREKELNQLNELFKEKKASVVLSSAMGGKGKTELCRRFIQQLSKDVDTLVIWLSGDSPQQFQQSVFEIGQELNIQTTDLTGKPISAEKIIQNISNKKKAKWVVIIDNVDEEFQDFYAAIDAFSRNGAFILVTSRRSDIESEKHIYLKDLEDVDAWEFVRSSLDEIPSHELIVELCKSLQNYPLALQQAVAYIKYKQKVKDDSYGIDEYLKELDLSTSLALDHKILSTGYPHTVLKVFELTLNKIKNINGKTRQNHSPEIILMKILSLVQPDGIGLEFLKELFSFFESKELFDSSISNLKSFSLIGVSKGEVSVHRIVQKMTRDQMKSENVLNLVIKKIFKKLKIDNLASKEIFHVIQIWKNVLPESEIIRKNSNFAVAIGIRLFKLSLYREIKEFSKITSEQFVKVLGPDHIDTLSMQYQLGIALEYNGEYEEALVKLQELWEKEKKVLGEEHKDTLICAGGIATVLWSLGRLDESLEWYERVFKSKVKVYGENHESTMATKHNMAVVLDAQGKIEEALSIYKQILEWEEKELGHEHPQTLTTRHNIATCLYGQGKFVEAKKEFEEVLELRVKVLGEEHADTLITKGWLSLTLYSLGQKEEALEMMEQVLISREKVLGLNHPHTNNTRDQISKWKVE